MAERRVGRRIAADAAGSSGGAGVSSGPMALSQAAATGTDDPAAALQQRLDRLEGNAEDPDGFEENLSSAMTTSDVGEVESAIDTIDERLETGGHSLSGLRYQKAQLLYRLGNDNEALSTIRSYTGADQPVLEGTLLYRIGRETEATTLFRESVSDLERPLFEGRIASDELAVAASGIVMLYVLAGEDSSRFFERVMDNGLLNEQQLEYARLVASLTRDEVVASMWPSRIQVQQ